MEGKTNPFSFTVVDWNVCVGLMESLPQNCNMQKMDFGTLYFIKQNGGENERWNMKMNVDFLINELKLN